jgi:hypothetical protein
MDIKQIISKANDVQLAKNHLSTCESAIQNLVLNNRDKLSDYVNLEIQKLLNQTSLDQITIAVHSQWAAFDDDMNELSGTKEVRIEEYDQQDEDLFEDEEKVKSYHQFIELFYAQSELVDIMFWLFDHQLIIYRNNGTWSDSEVPWENFY